MTITQRPASAAICGETLRQLAALRREAPDEAEAARHEARLSFAAACYDTVLADDGAPPAPAERLRIARAIIEAHVRDARAFIAATQGALAEGVAA